jgi:hypothetical protein
MPRDHFKQQMSNPYFQTKHYKEEGHAAQCEQAIEAKIKSILKKLKIIRSKKIVRD